jgi:DNA-binding SARP family transcriptional activator
VGGEVERGQVEDHLPPDLGDFASRPAPPGIDLIEAKPIPPLEDEVAYAVSTVLHEESSEQPVLYTVDGDNVTCSSEVPFPIGTSYGVKSQRLIVTVPLPPPNATVPPRNGRLGLVAIPSQNTTATIVDLFSAVVTSVVGRRDRCVGLASSILWSFAHRPARDIDVLVVGSLPLENCPRVDTVMQACAFVSHAPRPLVIFVEGERMADDAFERLIAATRRHGCAGIVTTDAHPDARAVLVAGEPGRCSVLLRAVTPKAASAADGNTAMGKVPSRSPNPSNSVEVSILGPVEIRNTTEPLAGHPLLTELVVYLAMHPEGATTSAWETAVWPNRRMPQQTIANRLSEARRALGDAADGRPRMRKVDERHLIADVRTDWEEFRAHSESEKPAAWRQALELVRGRPFGDLQQGQWALLEGFSAEIEHAISSLALRYGGFALRGGNPDDATWAAHRGLRATPWDERLHRLLMEAADANGDRAGVEATLRHLALVLEIDGDPLRAVHPETARLYERLLGGTKSALTNVFA